MNILAKDQNEHIQNSQNEEEKKEEPQKLKAVLKENKIEEKKEEEKNSNNNENNIEENNENKNENKKEEEKKEENIDEKNKEEEKKEEKDPNLKIINSNIKITEEEILNSPILIIKDEEGDILNGKEIKINAGGMINGRGKKDGVTIFSKINNSNNENNNKFKVDFDLNNVEKINYPYVFVIYFQKESKNYYIRAYSGKNSDNRLLYIKLSNNYNLPLKQKEIISAGNIIFQITPIENNKIEIIDLSKKHSDNESKKIFDPNDIKEVTIGRDKNCSFSFPKDKSFSRYQTTFSFDDDKKEWIIIDGNKNKSSTNGTWVFAIHSFIIKDQLIVEILNSKIKFYVKENDDK